MTDVIERNVGSGADELAAPAPVELTDAPPGARAARPGTVGVALRGAIAALLVGASAVHFGTMGEHAGMSWSHGLFFALVAFAQLGLAALVVTRSSRPVLLGVIVVNLAVLAVWIVSRTAGIEIGGDGTPEDWGWVDGFCAGFEAAAVLGSVALLSRRLSARPLNRGVGRGLVAFVAVVVIALTAWVFSPSFAEVGASADGHDHGAVGEQAAAGMGTDHSHRAADDKGLAALSNGHHHEIGPEKPLDPATRAQLSQQMNTTIEVARRYPTVAAAEAGGYRRVGGYMPGIGAHYITFGPDAFNPDGKMDDPDLRRPLSLIFDGTNPDSVVTGFMYYSMSPKEPEGFAGPNDVWHYHESLCLKYLPTGIDVPFGLDNEATPKQCASVGGKIMKLTQWMVHVWSVPGWESAQGLFGEVNPALACPDGTYYQRPAREWKDHPLNTCKSAA